jgi:hypothetical protein
VDASVLTRDGRIVDAELARRCTSHEDGAMRGQRATGRAACPHGEDVAVGWALLLGECLSRRHVADWTTVGITRHLAEV